MFTLFGITVFAGLVIGGRKTLQPLFHLLSVLLLLPSFLFACACLVLQAVTTRGSLFGFFDAIFSFVAAMYPWGTIVMLVGFAVLLAAGFRARWRRAAAGVVLALLLGSAAVMHWLAGMPDDPGQWWFFVPGLLSLLIAGGLLAVARPTAGPFVLQWPGGPRIDRDLREEALAAFRGQPGFRLREAGAAGWTWCHLPTFQDGPTPIDLELGFQDGTLRQISLFHDEPTLYGADEAAQPTNREHLRAEKTRVWLRSKGFPVGSYPWGEVWANYDPRSDFGSGGVRYAIVADRRAMIPVRPATTPARLPMELPGITEKTLLDSTN